MRSLQPNLIHDSWSETGKRICLSWFITVLLLLLSLQSRLHVILRPKNHFLPPLLIEASWVVRWPDKDVRKHRQRKAIMTEENLELPCNLEIEYPRQCIMNWYFSWRQCRYKSFFESMWRFLFSWRRANGGCCICFYSYQTPSIDSRLNGEVQGLRDQVSLFVSSDSVGL